MQASKKRKGKDYEENPNDRNETKNNKALPKKALFLYAASSSTVVYETTEIAVNAIRNKQTTNTNSPRRIYQTRQ